MKKLINAAQDVVREQLLGMGRAHPELRIHIDPHFVVRTDGPVNGKVALISGGGSGHEPMHAGFVGEGMLDGACPGEVFTSPTPDQMYACAKSIADSAGVLFIVKNYTGDVMNFETAVELLHAEGLPVQSILIDDDVAVKESLYTAGRRGVGTTVLAEKIVGAAAAAGFDLDQCAALGRRVSQNGRSLGMALTSCTVPAAGKPTFDLGEKEIEMGIGIHGEPGTHRMQIKPADELVAYMTASILDDPAYTRTVREWERESGCWVEKQLTDAPFQEGDKVIALVNSMGGTPISELHIAYRKLVDVCEARKISIARNLVGHYITSLEMQGFSITLLKADDEILEFWDAPVKTPALRWGA